MKTHIDSVLKKRSLAIAIASVLSAGSFSPALFAQTSDEDAAIEEVVSTATRLKGTAAAVLQERQNQAFVADILGAEQIARTGDGDAAAALRRVTGLTLVGGRFIYVRGLGERYSSTQLNGMTVPSPDPTRSVVPLDLFPSGIIESLNVQKSFSPNMPGHFGGGNVDIRTKSIPSDFVFNIGGNIGSNTENLDDGLFYEGGDDDWRGTDDGTRGLTSAFRQALGSNAGIGGDSSTTLADTQALLASLNPNIGSDAESIDPDFGINATLGNNYELDNGGVVGFLAAFAYRNRWQVSDELTGQLGGGTENPIYTSSLDGLSTEQNVQWSGMFNVGWEINNFHKLELKNMILHDMRDRLRDREFFDLAESDPGRTDLRRVDIIFEERRMVTTQLKGQHDFPEFWNTYIDWYAGTSRASRVAPGALEVTFETATNADGTVRFEGLWDIPGANIVRQDQILDDESDTYGFNAVLPLTGDGYEVELKVGADYYEKSREAENISFFTRHFAINDDFLGGNRLGDIFSPENINNPEFYGTNNGRGLFQDNTGDGDKFLAASKLNATYFMADAFIGDKWRVSGGVRYERFQQVSIPFEPHSNFFSDSFEEIQETVYNEDDFLPSLALTYILDQEMQVRFNISQTVIRPDLRDISTSTFIDPLTEFLVQGSPSLVQTELDNFDLRWEWYKPDGNNISVALFYKDMINPIEMVEFPGGEGIPLLLTANGDEAEVYGVEVEFLQDFNFISDDLNEFYMSGNVTISESEVSIDTSQDSLFQQQVREALGGQATILITNDTRRLVGHSEWVVNYQVGYDSNDGYHSASLIYNVAGPRIMVPGVNGFEDAEEEPFHSLDLVYTYYPDFNSQIRFRVQNILDEKREILQNGAAIYDETVGTGFNVSYRYNF